GCVNCNKSEDALVDLEKEGETSFATFVTDAPGLSGQYASYREDILANKMNIDSDIGHPWAVFAGGPGQIIGAASASSAYAEYLTEIESASMLDMNLTFGGQMIDNSGTLDATVSIGNPGDSDETILVEAFLVEKSSRWLNYQGHPIPNAFVDILVNDTYTVPAGEILDIESSWINTTAVQFSDLRLGNIGLVVVAWQDDIQINSLMIVPEGEDELYMIAQEPEKSALPNSTAEFEFTLYNYMDTQITVNLSVDAPSSWDTEFSQTSLSIPAESSVNFDLTVTGNITWDGQTGEFKIIARDVSDLTIQTYSTVVVEVKDDIAPPQIINPTHEPEVPDADQQISIEIMVGDMSEISSVQMSYFSCTPQACSPYFIVDMNNTDGNTYTAEAYPLGLDHTDFHYRIIATDVYGNENITEFYEIELSPVDDGGHTPEIEIDTQPKWIGVVLLSGIAIAALVIVLTSREKSSKPKKKDELPEEEKPMKEPAEPVQDSSPGIDKEAARARIQKAFNEGRLSEAQYNHNMEKFKD
ncbi:MAG: hypothetical protein KAJ33_02535, partial [Thermoplasmata archaeon]|nr:hypothetical protein [Thermoplasmata archaeon]